MRTKKQRILAGICAAFMAFSLLAPVISMIVRADDDFTEERTQISDLGQKYNDLKNQAAALQSEINKIKGEKEKQIAIKQQIGNQIDNTKAQITLLSDRIAMLEDEIGMMEQEMELKQNEIDQNYELFKLRFRAMTKTPSGSQLGMVLGADNFSQFVNRTMVTSRVAEYDRDMIADLTRQKQEMERIKQGIESDKSLVEGDKAEMDEKNQQLNVQMAETQKHIQDIAAEEQIYLKNKKEIDAAMAKVQAEIDAIYKEIARRSTQATYVGGKMSLPTPTLTQITSQYGWRFGGSDFHTGIDFSGGGAYGTPIRATNAGTVAYVNTVVTGSGYSGGYGKYLIIDHGGGITTLYAHCSSISVKEGDVVAAGQTIAQVGSTGWSTGPHLHFEVRENGKHVNPVRYLYG